MCVDDPEKNNTDLQLPQPSVEVQTLIGAEIELDVPEKEGNEAGPSRKSSPKRGLLCYHGRISTREGLGCYGLTTRFLF